MKKLTWTLMLALICGATTVARGAAPAPATQPTRAQTTTEIRALEEFNRGNWKLALPLLKKAVQELNDQPMRQGALQEAIRVCEKNIANGNAPPTKPDAENRKPHEKPKPGEVRELAIKDLGNFEYDADHGGSLPADVKALNGATLRIKGFMIPMDQADSITQFALVPSLFACCYGQPPQVQHTIIVHAPKGKSVGYFPDEIVVQGKLTVDEKKEDGFVISIFEIECDSVKATAK